VYIDEAGIDNRLYREYGRSSRGQKIYGEIPGKKRERVSIIGGLMNKKFMAPFTFQGGCNTEVFNIWLAEVLLPDLPKGTTIIMDNAAFHKSVKTRKLIENAGCLLLFLPTYSPDFNPIEHWWHKIKSILRPLIQQPYDNLHNLLDHYLSYI
jgi:transposase